MLTKETLNATIWAACDTFRGTIDATQYKDYILTMLFVKYISDVNKQKAQEYHQKYNGDLQRIDRAMSNERFKIPETSNFEYLYENRNATNIGELINNALAAIEEANRKKLTGVFRSIDFNSEANLGQTKDRNLRLRNLLTDFAPLNLQPQNLQGNDVIGDAYEFLISKFASDAGKKAGEFYTPTEVSELLAKLVEAKNGDRICDPTCGSGSLLLKVAKQVGNNNVALNGQELNGSTWALARMNMFLHEMDNANIEWGDTLNNPKLLENDQLKKFDIVVANPPFSIPWNAQAASTDTFNRFALGTPPKSKADYAFLMHMLATLNQHGTAGVVLPHGVLFRGSSEGKIRKQLIEKNWLKAVIGLPVQLFYGTGIPAAILIFQKNKTTNDVLFIDASREFINGKNQNTLSPQNIDKIFDTYKNWEAIDKYSYIATTQEIKENDFNLNIPRYVDTFEEEAPVDIAQTQLEITQLKEQLAQAEKQMQEYLEMMNY